MRRVGDVARRVRAGIRAARDRPPQAFEPGVFYSPVVDADLVLGPERSRLWPADVVDPTGFDVRASAQLSLLERLGAVAGRIDRTDGAPGYDEGNDQFPPQDAVLLGAMLRLLRPARVVEVGCGWSTTVTAATIADAALGTELVCIEPYPRDFIERIPEVSALRREKVEHTPFEVFRALEAGDVLFIDSSHVAKTGSDVTHLFLEVLPRLADGVVVHVHDIFIPAEYPTGWVGAGFGWNEQYLLQAFLTGHGGAQILAMNHWLALRHPEAFRSALGSDHELSGSSVWFELSAESSVGPSPA